MRCGIPVKAAHHFRYLHCASMYNESMAAGPGAFIAPMALSALAQNRQPSSCIGCHSCEQVCPQQIHIPDALYDFAVRVGQKG